MVAKGTYTELQQSGVDFTSLLKKEEEEEQQQPPQDVIARRRTLSQNSVASSVHSVKDGDQLPVRASYPLFVCPTHILRLGVTFTLAHFEYPACSLTGS